MSVGALFLFSTLKRRPQTSSYMTVSVKLFHHSWFFQVSEEQLNDAIAQAVEKSKLRKDKSQWNANGATFHHLHISF